MAVQINTAAVSETADQINILNKKIRDELSEVDAAVQSLRSIWEGEAASSGINKYDYIKRNFFDARFTALDGLVSFIKIQVGEGYEAAEQAVATAADAFK